jgi:uncharacterized membrane protein YccC
MTAHASRGDAEPVGPATGAVPARRRRVLRLALGTTLSFVTAEMLDWELSFVVTVFLVQLLTAPGPAPGLRQGLAIVLVLALATGAAATVSGLLVDMPVLFAIVLGLVLFLTFALQRSSPAAAMLMLVAFSLLPVVAVQAPDSAPDVAFYLVRSSAIAVLWTWLLSALLPDLEEVRSRIPDVEGATAPPGSVGREALADTAVLLPVILLAMTFEVPAALVIVLTVTAVLRQHSIAGGRQVALGLLLGNLVGGVTAVVAYQLLSAAPTLGFLAALLFLISLVFAYLIANAASQAPLIVTALITFVIVFGTGVAPFLDEPGATLAIRLRNLVIACVYTFVALSVTGRGVREPRGRGPMTAA